MSGVNKTNQQYNSNFSSSNFVEDVGYFYLERNLIIIILMIRKYKNLK